VQVNLEKNKNCQGQKQLFLRFLSLLVRLVSFVPNSTSLISLLGVICRSRIKEAVGDRLRA
jgi:hypothetical protein